MSRFLLHAWQHPFRILLGLVLVMVVLSVGAGSTARALAEANPQINYQGKLTDASGVAVSDGVYNMRFWLLTSPSVATTSAVWTESLTGSAKVQVTNGLFSVMLGSSSPLTGVDFNQTLYLGVEIGSTTTSPVWDGEMSPRKILGTVPAAFEARRLDGVASSSFLRSDEEDTMQASSTNALVTFIQDGVGAIARFFSGATEVFTILANGNVGVGTSTPSQQLTVVGNTRITGAYFDGTNASGTTGMVLQTTGTTTRWVSTTTLGFGTSSIGILDELLDVTITGATTGNLLSYNGSAWVNVATNTLGLSSSFTNSAQLAALLSDETGTGLAVFGTGATLSSTTLSGNTYLSGSVGIGTTSPSAKLTLSANVGDSYQNLFVISSSTSAATTTQLFAISNTGDVTAYGDIYSKGVRWMLRNAAADDDRWGSITYGNGLFVAVGWEGNNRVMTSPDGINWTPRSAAGDNDYWESITYGNGLFVAVGDAAGGDAVMTSPDGINWTVRSAAGNNDSWYGVTYGNGTFVAVGQQSGDIVMTSLDGINWTARSAAGNNDRWQSVTYGNGLFVAVAAYSGDDRVMTSPDGITWTARTAEGNDDSWKSVVYGNGLFVAVGEGANYRQMTSSDGATWTGRNSLFNANGVTYGNGLFVAVGDNKAWTSPDGISWTERTTPSGGDYWSAITYANGMFVAVSHYYASGNRVMTSGKMEQSLLAHNNLYQGSWSFMNQLAVGTTSTSSSFFIQSKVGVNPFTIASSSGSTLLTVLQNGNVGIGTTSPSSLFTIQGDMRLTGRLADSASSTGSVGNVLLATTGGTAWTATTSLGLSSFFSTSAQLAALLSDETGTGTAVFSAAPTFTGMSTFASLISNGSTTIGGGTQNTGLTIWGGATTTGNHYVAGYMGIGKQPTANIALDLLVGAQGLRMQGAATTDLAFTSYLTGDSQLRFLFQSDGTLKWGSGSLAADTNLYRSAADTLKTDDNFIALSLFATASSTIGGGTQNTGLTILGGATTTLNHYFASGVGIGTSSPTAKLTISANLGDTYGNLFQISSSTSATTTQLFAISNTGDVTAYGDIYSKGARWMARSAAGDDEAWYSIAYGNGLFVAAKYSGGSDVIMISPDGINWSTSTAPAGSWTSITYGNGLFVAVGYFNSDVITSPDGINWTSYPTIFMADPRIAYGNGTFVVVGSNTVVTSSNGVDWVQQSVLGDNDSWSAVTFGRGRFVAVSGGGDDYVATSPDGITWTSQTPSNTVGRTAITYGNGLFVVLSAAAAGAYPVMTSPDGVVWTERSAAGNNDSWGGITYGNGLFVAVGNSGDRVMTSPDGINWTARSAAGDNDSWRGITYGNGTFVAVGSGPDVVMTSGKPETSALAHNNIYQGNWSFMNQLAVGTTSTSSSFFIQSKVGVNPFTIASSSGSTLLTVLQNGNVGIGTTTPSALLTVAGDMRLTGRLADASSSTGSVGQLLMATATGTQWVSTTTLGFGTSSIGILDELLDVTITGATTGNLLSYNGSAWVNVATNTLGLSSSFTNSAQLAALLSDETGTGLAVFGTGATLSSTTLSGNTYVSGSFGIGSTSPSAKLTIAGTTGQDFLRIASTTGSTTLALLENGNLELPGQLISAGIEWTAQVAASTTGTYYGSAYGNGLFVAVGNNGLVMASPDGVTWTAQVTASTTALYYGVTYGNGLFVAVSDGIVMTSSNGITWTARSAAGDNDGWRAVTYGNGLFVVVGVSGDRVMTSPDGINWTPRSAASDDDTWYDVVYGYSTSTGGLFVAVSDTGDPVMTSPDGITWTARTAAGATGLISVAYGNGVFVAGSYNTPRMIISYDGVTWTTLSLAGNNDNWQDIEYGNGLFVAVANSGTGSRVVTSPDGMNWTERSVLGDNDAWQSVTYGNGRFVAVGSSGDRVMTSGKMEQSLLAHNNLYQGSWSFMNQLAVGTTSTSSSFFIQSKVGVNPFTIASSSGSTLFTLLQNGNVGIGSSTPGSLLALQSTGVSGTSTVGISQYLGLANTINGATQYGNLATIVTTNTATTTLVGSLLRIQDSSLLGNTVRGLEVQAHRGTTTLGENTALSGFARTFGVRGTTEGDAGAIFEPAGVYGETRGTAQGNAIRGYSSSITTATLLSLFQDTSTFAGTGLQMNFGNSGGSFSSSSSRFLDFKVSGTSRFLVNASGTVTIGDGTNQAGLQIGKGGLCVDSDGSCTASTSGRISATDYHTGNSDLAEMYFSSDRLKNGEIVALDGGLSVRLATVDNKATVIGVVSTQPGLTLGADDSSLRSGERAYPIALSGRVPIRLSNENGPIKKGDQLMLSSLPGVAMKASSTGMVVGVALEDFDSARAYSETFVNQFGENIIEPEVIPFVPNDPRIDDGCYYGAGGATGEAPCVPLTATTTDAQQHEAEALALREAKEEALRELATIPSEMKVLADGREVQVGQVVMFVKLQYRYLDEAQQSALTALMSTSSYIYEEGDEDSVPTLFDRMAMLASSFMDGVLSILKLDAKEVKTDKLCVGDTCVDEATLRKLLERSNAEGQVIEVLPVVNTGGGSGTENNPTPTPDPVPETEEVPIEPPSIDEPPLEEVVGEEEAEEVAVGEEEVPEAEVVPEVVENEVINETESTPLEVVEVPPDTNTPSE